MRGCDRSISRLISGTTYLDYLGHNAPRPDIAVYNGVVVSALGRIRSEDGSTAASVRFKGCVQVAENDDSVVSRKGSYDVRRLTAITTYLQKQGAEIIEKNCFILKISGRSSNYFATNN